MKVPLNRLAPCFQTFPEEADYVIKKVPARSLLSWRRFDFYAKLLYIDYYNKNLDMSWAKELYTAQVRAITGNTDAEKGNKDKNSVSRFITIFEDLIEDIRDNGFDDKRTLIPVDANGYVIDGAHRVACAAYFNQDVTILQFLDWSVSYSTDSRFLKNFDLAEKYLDSITLESCRWKENLFMICLWSPTWRYPKERKQAIDLISSKTNVVYTKIIRLNAKALRNFCLQIYGHMEWIGNIDNHFSGVDAKVKEIFDGYYDKVEFILVEADDYATVLKLKTDVRKIFNIGLSSIHTTDNIRETRQIADLIYNPNSIFHIRYGCPDKFVHSYNLMLLFKQLLKDNNYDLQKYAIDSSMVMAVNGLRDATDLDFISIDTEQNNTYISEESNNSLECHNTSIEFHSQSIEDLIYNPNNYFVFNELKFLTPFEVKKYKDARGDKRNLADARLIQSYLSKRKWGMLYDFSPAVIKYHISLSTKLMKILRLPGRIYRKILKILGLYELIYKK